MTRAYLSPQSKNSLKNLIHVLLGGEDEDDDGGSAENADQLPYKELPPESRLSSTASESRTLSTCKVKIA